MKIHYEPYTGFNERHDFGNEGFSLDLSFLEPEEPKLLKEIGVDYIVKEIMKKNGFKYSFYRLSSMSQLLPEQIRILMSHAYVVATLTSTKNMFADEFYSIVRRIAEQEIEPGMFRNEDIL
ncbi:MAG: hypothetical protein ACXACY_23605 [Candidatus Hodarchaeales archaeon]|jgi:hypothetical protein